MVFFRNGVRYQLPRSKLNSPESDEPKQKSDGVLRAFPLDLDQLHHNGGEIVRSGSTGHE
jgi:hypothetical protein